MYQKVLTDLLPKLVEDGVKQLNANQDSFASQLLIVVRCKNLSLKLSNQQLRKSIGFCLGAIIVDPHLCVCGKKK